MSVDKVTQKITVHLPDLQSIIIIQSADLSHILGCDLEQNQTRLIMSGSTFTSVFPRYYKITLMDN